MNKFQILFKSLNVANKVFLVVTEITGIQLQGCEKWSMHIVNKNFRKFKSFFYF